jgi:hypothetical protein
MQGLTPSITLLLGAAMGTEALSFQLVATVLAISAGSAISCVQQGRMPGFSLLGLNVQVCIQHKNQC